MKKTRVLFIALLLALPVALCAQGTQITLTSGSATFASGAKTAGTAGYELVAADLTGNITLTSNCTFTVASNRTLTGIISGAFSLTKAGASLLTLSGLNTYSGGTTISAGAIVLSNGTGTLGSGTITLAGGGLALSPGSTGNTYTYANNINVTENSTLTNEDGVGVLTGNITIASGKTLTLGTAGWGGKNLTVSGVISGAGNLTITPNGLRLTDWATSGDGLVTLTGNNTFTGTTTLTNGSLNIGNGGATGSLASASIVNNGSITFNSISDVTIAGVISGTGSLTKTAENTLTLTANNTYTGATTISDGLLRIGNGGATGSLASASIAVNTVFRSLKGIEFNSSTDVTIASVITGSGDVIKNGTNTLTLTGANTQTGSFKLDAGNLIVTNKLASQIYITNGTTFYARNGCRVGDVFNSGTFAVQAGASVTTGRFSGGEESQIYISLNSATDYSTAATAPLNGDFGNYTGPIVLDLNNKIDFTTNNSTPKKIFLNNGAGNSYATFKVINTGGTVNGFTTTIDSNPFAINITKAIICTNVPGTGNVSASADVGDITTSLSKLTAPVVSTPPAEGARVPPAKVTPATVPVPDSVPPVFTVLADVMLPVMASVPAFTVVAPV